jgi:hypothetical protein
MKKSAFAVCTIIFAFTAGIAAADGNAAIQAIAAKLGDALKTGPEAYDAAVLTFWPAEGMPLAHEPALPQDGVMKAEQIKAAGLKRTAGNRAAMPDFAFKNAQVRVITDTIYVLFDQTGTMKDGTKFNSPLVSRFKVADGKFASVVLAIDLPSLKPMLDMQARAAKQ